MAQRRRQSEGAPEVEPEQYGERHGRRRRLTRWMVPAVCVVAGLAVGVGATAVYGRTTAPASAGTAAATETMTATVSAETLEQSVSVTGSLAAVSADQLTFQAAGKVIAVNVEAGDVVAAGDVLAEIDTLQLESTLRSAEAELAQAEATLADAESSSDGSEVSDAQIAAAQAAVDVRAAAVADAEQAMDDAQLTATIDGIVTSQPYAVGDAVTSGGSAGNSASSTTGTPGSTATTTTSLGISIVGQDEWTVSVNLTEEQVALIATGNQVTFTADGVDQFFGVVTDVAALPGTTSGTATYPATLQVTGQVEGLFEGVSVTADIIYSRRVDVLTVATNAITTTDGTSTVTMLDDDNNEQTVEVTVGETVGTLTEITAGLSEGDQVLITYAAPSTGESGDGDTQLPQDGFQMPEGGFQMPEGGFQMPGGFPGEQ